MATALMREQLHRCVAAVASGASRVTLLRRGHPAAVLVSVADADRLRELEAADLRSARNTPARRSKSIDLATLDDEDYAAVMALTPWSRELYITDGNAPYGFELPSKRRERLAREAAPEPNPESGIHPAPEG